MMKKILLMFAAAATVSALFAADPPKTNLGKLYEKDFLIGVALPQQVTSQQDKNRADLAASQFNCLTPENCMKWDATEPQEGKFNFGPGDELVKYAQKHKIKIHGHMRHIGHPLFNDERYGGDKILRGNTSSSYAQFINNCFKVCPRQATA